MPSHSRSNRPNLFRALCAVVFLLAAPWARAGLTLEMNVIRYHQYGYYFFPNLGTNTSGPSVPFGDYFVASYGYPTNGSSALYHFTTNGFNQSGGGSSGYGDFDGMMHELTNRTWSIFVTNSVTTNVYHFAVTTTIVSNTLPYVAISFPADGAVNVTNKPTFAWKGPTNYNGLVVYEYNDSATLPVTQTNWLSSRVLYQGLNSFTAHYDSNSTTAVVSSIPTNNASQPISTWVSTAHLQDYSGSQFTVGTPDPSGGSHTLVAHYPFNATSGPVLAAAVDTSGHGYNMTFGGSYGSQGGTNMTADSAAGIGAVQFHDGDNNSAGYLGWTNPTPPALLSVLARDFSVSCWIKTSQNIAWDQAPAYYGAGIVAADNGGLANDVIPLALTGSKIGFNTGGDSEDVTLNSVASVNDGNYHHLVVTRNRLTGQKMIYVDGLFDSFSSGSTNLLSDPRKLTIGAVASAADPDPDNFNYYNGYDGKLDDLQIYSGVLSSNEVAQLFASPGATITDKLNFDAYLAGRYDFEITNSPDVDSSGNGNNAGCGSGNGGTNLDTFSTDAAVGAYARKYFGDTGICFYPGSSTFANLSNAYRGSFSLTAWVKTTNSVNADFANAYFGNPILFDYNASTNSAIFSITGGKAAFTIGNSNGTDTVIHSTTSVNDGIYHLLIVTRSAASGDMKLYVDGNLEAAGTSLNAPVVLNTTMYLAGGNAGFYKGLLDDVRIYATDLTASDVSVLAGHGSLTLVDALDATGLTWITSGAANWFPQTTNTHDTVDAARSGGVTNSQTSILQTTVTGPGTLTFWWSSIAEDSNFGFDYEFDLDGGYKNDISGDTTWQQDGPYNVGPGTHTLTWKVFANGDADPTQAGYLDQVHFVSVTDPPVITWQPLDQTNYPGYSATLLANSTNIPAPTWQWFKTGSGLIAGATNKLYVPTNSGTAGVAGGYYAVAANLGGSANTRTALVAFASAPLPPDWYPAFRAQIYGADFGQATTNYGIACLVDAGGNIYSANSFSGTNYFGSDLFVSGGNRFSSGLFKHTATGTAIWGQAMTNSGNGNSYPQCLAHAPGDGVYMSGVFFGTNRLGTNVLQETAGGSVYLARFDAGGNVLWARTFGGTNSQFQSYHQLVADPAGNVTIAALGNNLVDFGATNIVLNGQQGVLVQYDANGNLRWIQQPSGQIVYMAYSDGRIYGSMNGNPTNYVGGLTNISDRQSVLVALNATNGQALWLRGVASVQGQSVLGDTPRIAVSGANVFLVGSGAGSNAAFGPFIVTWPVSVGQYFARYDTNGTAQFATTFGGESVIPWTTVADASGNVYVGGDFDGYAAFGNKTIGGAHSDAIQNGFFSQTFLAKFDRNGNNLWVRQALSPNYVNQRDLAVASNGVWVCGFVNQYATFGTNTVSGTVTCIGSPFCALDYHVGGFLAKITDPAAAGLPVTLLNPQSSDADFQFQFQSQSGFNHAVQYRTNLVSGNDWQTYSNVTGNGASKTIPIPLSVFSPAKQGFVRVLTQ